MRCSVCNYEIAADEAKFCPNCGIRLGAGKGYGGFVTYVYIGLGSRTGITYSANEPGLEDDVKNADKICRRYGAITERRKRNVLVAKFRDNPIGRSSAELASYAGLEIQEYCRKKTPADRNKDVLTVFIGIDGGKRDESTSSIGSLREKHLEGARRLHAKAGPGSILISHNIADTIGYTFLTKPLGFYRLQMQKTPLRIFELVGVKPSRPLALETERGYKIIGHDEEYKRIIRLLDKTEKNKTPSLTVVTGETGWGKTELLCQISEKATEEGWYVLSAYGDAINRFTPYKIWGNIYDKISLLHDDAIISDKEYIQYLRRDYDDLKTGLPKPEIIRTRIQSAFINIVKSIVSEGPVLIAIDDIHLIDCASFELLNDILTQVKNGALAIVTASRTERNFARQPELRIELAGFDETAADTVIGYFSKTSELDSAIVRNLYKRSSGNPFVLTWLVKLSTSEIPRTPGVVNIYVPLSVPELTANRIATLDAGNLEMLELLYNSGCPVALKDLVLTNGKYLRPDNTRLNERVNWLNDFNFVTVYKDSCGEYVGLKGYCRDSFQVRKIEPGLADLSVNVQYLEETQETNNLLLGHYYLRYGDASKAFDFFMLAAENSLEIGADLDAQSILSTAIEALESDGSARATDGLAFAYRSRGDVFYRLGLTDLALQDYKVAITLYGKNQTPTDLVSKYVRILADEKLYDESIKYITNALENAHAANEVRLETRYTELAGDIYINAGDLTAAAEKYEKAIKLNKGGANECKLKYKKGFTKTMKCDIDSGINDFEDSQKTGSGLEKTVSELFMAAFLPDKGALPRAGRVAEEAIKTLAKYTDLSGLTDTYALTALASLAISPAYRHYETDDELLLSAGRLNGNAKRYISDYISLLNSYETGRPPKPGDLPNLDYRGIGKCWQAIILGARFLLTAELNLRYYGYLTAAEAYLNSAYQTFSRFGLDYYATDSILIAAETALERGDAATARRKIENREVEAKKRGSYLYLAEYNRIYGTILACEGSTDEGAHRINSASVVYKEYGMAFKEALSYISLARMFTGGRAVEYLKKATWLLKNKGATGWIKKFECIKPRSKTA
jgi:tetratricopeptide (TPR) repeat protein